MQWASQVVLVVKNPPTNAGDIRDTGSVPGSERFPRGGNGNPLQYSCLENPMDGGAWRATVHGITESQTWLKWLSMPVDAVYIHYMKVKVKSLSHVWLFLTPWTVAYQVPPSVGFSKQEYSSGLPLPSPNAVWDSLKGFSERVSDHQDREYQFHKRL